MDLQFSFEVSVSNGASRFVNFDLWVLEEVHTFMGVWRAKRREKEEGGKGRAMVENERNNGGEGDELWNSRVHLSLVEAPHGTNVAPRHPKWGPHICHIIT
ncbi:hypothetical protein DVH24_003065 [Malus domestica]|uniref:Uncharacterized protein n=1 Tax=Malus domestica TaxID=3750 RepID=A0A498K6L2_MALDO|nr:hypothetical protein DVH24_003065 [Malus domestica]